MKFGSITSLLLALLVCLDSAYAQIQYELRGFGSRHAVIIFSGEGHDSLTVTPSSDGQNVRITGVNVNFETVSPGKTLPIISSIRQVKRGGFTDLIINLSGSGEITATPSAKDLQIFIRRRGDAAIAPKGTAENGAEGTQESGKSASVPIRVVPGGKSGGDFQSITILLPDPVSQQSSLPITAGLIWVSYGIETIWRWAAGIPLDFSAGMTQSEQIAGFGDREAKIQALTAELNAAKAEITTLKQLVSER